MTTSDIIHQLQDTIDRLTAENNDLKDCVSILQKDLKNAQNQIIQANDNLRISEHQKSISYATIKTQLETKTTALFAALAKLDAANAAVAKLNSIVQHEVWKQNRSVESAESEQKRIQDNCNHLNDIVKTQAETIKIASQKLTEAKTNEEHLAQKTILLYNTNQNLSGEITILKKQIEELKKQIENSPTVKSNDNQYKKEWKNIYNRLLEYWLKKPTSAPPPTPNTSSSSSSK